MPAFVNANVKQNGEVRLQAARSDGLNLSNGFVRDTPSATLVRVGCIRISITEDPLAGLKSRANDLASVFGTGREN